MKEMPPSRRAHLLFAAKGEMVHFFEIALVWVQGKSIYFSDLHKVQSRNIIVAAL